MQKGRRSPALDTRNPRLHPIAELTTAGHEHFVGRTWELAGLGADFIGPTTGAEVKPVAVIIALGGNSARRVGVRHSIRKQGTGCQSVLRVLD